MTDAELDFSFKKFHIKRLAAKVGLYLRLRDHLAAGGSVIEDFAGEREWSCSQLLPAGSFVREFYTPENHNETDQPCLALAICVCLNRVYVNCDQNCGALMQPQTPEETKASLAHWKDHAYIHGCSHGR